MAMIDYLQTRCYDIQFMLRRLGYYRGLMGNVPNEVTVRSVKAFQRDIRIPYHGRVDALTLTKLEHCANNWR